MAITTINALPSYGGTADQTNDLLPIFKNGSTSTNSISIGNLLSLSSQPVGINDSQTLTNKILTTPTINGATLSGTLSGTYTIGGTPTFPASVVTLTGSQTLTNKVLTSPTINSPSITNATLSADAITGYSVAGSGTIYGLGIAAGAITTAGYASSTALQANAVQANQLATNAITLGYAEITSNQTSTDGTGNGTSIGLSVTVTVPSGGRRVKITVQAPTYYNSIGGNLVKLILWQGSIGGTQLRFIQTKTVTASYDNFANLVHVHTPGAGSVTYVVALSAPNGGTSTIYASATGSPIIGTAFILVEAI